MKEDLITDDNFMETDPETYLNEDISTEEVNPQGWKNPPTLSELEQDFKSAGEDFDVHTSKVEDWLDTLKGKPSATLANAPAGKSKHVNKLCLKQAQLRIPALSEPFLDDDELFTILPKTKNDVNSAKQNSLVLNHQFNEEIDKVALIDNLVQTANYQGTVALRVGWCMEKRTEEVLKPIYDYYVDNSPENVQKLFQLSELYKQDPVKFKNEVPKPVQRVIELALKTEQPYAYIQTGEELVEEEVLIKNQPTVDVVNYTNYVIDPACGGDVKKAKFVVFVYESSLSELESTGLYFNLDKLRDLPGSDPLGDEDAVSKVDRINFRFSDQARKTLKVQEYWGYYDYDDTGIVKPFVATWVGSTLIRMEENPYPTQFLPLVQIKYLNSTNDDGNPSLFGEPDAEVIGDNQKLASAIGRGMIDLLGRSANSQQGTAKGFLDPVNKRRFKKGLDYDFNMNIPPERGIFMHQYPQVPPSAYDFLSMQVAEAEALTGTQSKHTDQPQSKGSANGLPNPIDVVSLRESSILRRLKKGMEEVGKMILAMNSEFLEEEKIIRITDEEFIPVNRESLKGNFDLKIQITTAAENNQRASELSFMLQTVGPKIDPMITYRIMANIARLRKMPALADMLEDYEPQPDPIAQEKAQLENELIKANIANEYAWAENRKADAMKTMAEARQTSSDADQKDLDFVEQESGLKHARDVDRITSQARAQGQSKIAEAIVNKQLNPKTDTPSKN